MASRICSASVPRKNAKSSSIESFLVCTLIWLLLIPGVTLLAVRGAASSSVISPNRDFDLVNAEGVKLRR